LKSRSTIRVKRYLLPQNLLLRFSILLYSLIGVLGSWKVGAYADSPADALLAKYNFGFLFKISGFTNGFPLDWDVFVASYGYSVSLFIFGPIWIIGRIFDPNFGLQNEVAIFLRNLLTYSMGMLGVVALYRWGTIVLRPRLQFLPLLLPLFAPTLFGNFFMNSKDVPLFTGFSSLMCLIALLFDKVDSNIVRSLEVILWTFISIVFTFGVRPISIAWVSPLLLAILVLSFKQKSTYIKPLTIGICIALLYTMLTNYYLLTNPLFWLSNLVSTGQNFPWTGAVLSWGQLYRSPEIPGSYFAEMLFAQFPLFTIFLIPVYLVRIRKKSKKPLSVVAAISLTIFVILQTLVLEPVIYDNGRQLLFVWGLLSLIFMWLLSEVYPTIMKFKSVATIVMGLILITSIDQVRLFPYNYIYRNEIAQLLPQGSFETDYWGISGKEMTRWVINDARTDGEPNSKFAYIFQQSFDPFLSKSNLELVSINELTAKYYSQIWRPGLLPDYSAQCPIAYSVERSFLLGKKEVLGYVRKCE